MATNRMMMPMSCPASICCMFHLTSTLRFSFNFTDSQLKYFMVQLPSTRISTRWNQTQTALAKTSAWKFRLELKRLTDPGSALSSWGHANHLENGLADAWGEYPMDLRNHWSFSHLLIWFAEGVNVCKAFPYSKTCACGRIPSPAIFRSRDDVGRYLVPPWLLGPMVLLYSLL